MGNRIVLAGLGLFACLTAGAADISVDGGWWEQIDSADLAAGAGTDLRSSLESPAGVSRLDITNTSGQPWSVRVSCDAAELPAGLVLAVRRTTDGSGGGSVSGGTGYLTLGATERVLFTGTADRTSVGLQYRLEGLGVTQSPAVLVPSVTYSIE